MAEIHTTKSLIQYLNFLGHFCWMNEIGGMPDNRNASGRRRLRGGKDSPDIIGVLKDGRMIALEVKEPVHRAKITRYQNHLAKYGHCGQHPESDNHVIGQIMFIDELKKRGALAMFVYNVNEGMRLFNGENQ